MVVSVIWGTGGLSAIEVYTGGEGEGVGLKMWRVGLSGCRCPALAEPSGMKMWAPGDG